MGWSSLRLCAVLELSVVLFQIGGVAALCVNRLLPATRWAKGGRIGFVVALLGLGIAAGLLEPAGWALGGTINALSYLAWAVWLIAVGVLVLARRSELAPATRPVATAH